MANVIAVFNSSTVIFLWIASLALTNGHFFTCQGFTSVAVSKPSVSKTVCHSIIGDKGIHDCAVGLVSKISFANDERKMYSFDDSHASRLEKTAEDFDFPLYNDDDDIDESPYTEDMQTTAEVYSLINNADTLPNLLNILTLAIFL
jgi:hypothetical protein